MPSTVRKQPRTLKHPTRWVLIGALVILIIAGVGGYLGRNATSGHQSAPTPSVTATPLNTRAQLLADVQETTANVKSYLKTHPTANATTIQNAKIAINAPKYERVNIAGDYKVWYVVGQDTRQDKNVNYNYQSLTNTYRWYNNKTGKSTDITEANTPRNTRASR